MVGAENVEELEQLLWGELSAKFLSCDLAPSKAFQKLQVAGLVLLNKTTLQKWILDHWLPRTMPLVCLHE